MNMAIRGILVVSLVTAATAISFSWPGALASGGDKEKRAWPAVRDEAWVSECGACHVPYPPRLLPAASWDRVMDGLADHFGENAELPPETSERIRSYLKAHASGARGIGWRYDDDDKRANGAGAGNAAPLRITETGWFRHEHDEISTRVWAREAVGSPANCGACHRGADKGEFNEHRIKIPK